MRRVFDPVLVLLGALAVYLPLGQGTFYGVDGWMLVRRVSVGDVRSDMHLTYKPMVWLAVRVGESLGVTPYAAMVAASGVGVAIGVSLIHVAARVLGASRRDALLVAAVAGLFPGVVFFATVVERHGPFFAFAGLTALASAWVARSPTVASGLGFALSCTLAYAAHSTGVLMVAAFLPIAAAWARLGITGRAPAPWRPIVIAGIAAGVGTAVGMIVARRIGIWAGTVEHEGDNLAFFLQHAAAHVDKPWLLPVCAWHEVLTGFAPMSVLWLAALRDPRPRLVAWAVGIAIGVYLLFSFLILGDFDERGAYSLPLAWPLAWVAVRRLPRRLSLVCLVASASLAIIEVAQHDDHHLAPRAEGLAAIAGEREPFLLAIAPEDFELLFLYQPHARPISGFYDALDATRFPDGIVRDNAATLVGYLRARRGEGKMLLLTKDGLAALEAPPEHAGEAGPLVLDVLRSGFTLVPVARAGFEGFRLEPRT